MKNLILVFTVFASLWSNSQTGSKPTIAVANPNVEGLSLTPTLAAKLIQLELIKLNKFSVYDEFDMAEVLAKDSQYSQNCYGITCLSKMGKELNVDYIISGSFNGLGNKIAISLKWVDIKTGTLHKSMVREFDNQEQEIQRMVEILLKEMTGLEVDKVLSDRLKFNNEMITSNNVGRVNNSGPRIGYAAMVGDMQEFALRPQSQGGLDIFPALSMIGYQLEKQYVGTENFSALFEGIFNVSGLEQGQFIPTITLLNGFRFGKAGWEFAFGPGFGLKKVSEGFFDRNDIFGQGKDTYFSSRDWQNYSNDNFRNSADSLYYDDNNNFTSPTAQEIAEAKGVDNADSYALRTNLDSRGDLRINTTFLFAFGRTFKAGALNIPVNVFYSSSRGGGLTGVSVGFNVVTNKTQINTTNDPFN
jgi:TolB-like protein